MSQGKQPHLLCVPTAWVCRAPSLGRSPATPGVELNNSPLPIRCLATLVYILTILSHLLGTCCVGCCQAW